MDKDNTQLDGPFRIHVVAEMTGVPEPTLRAWERRYNIPRPERTSSGYRLYSQHEVEQVRAMLAACERGMSASEAANWVRSRTAQGPSEPQPGASATRAAASTDSFARIRGELRQAVEAMDDVALEQALRRVMFVGDAPTILEAIIKPTLIEIGAAWHSGEVTVAQEHFASQKFNAVLRDLLRLSAPATVSRNGRRVLLAAFADDEHEMGLLGFAIHLGSWGIPHVYLGARTPPAAIQNGIQQVRPSLVALSITAAPTAARARELVDEYASACRVSDVPWLVGGSAVASIADLVQARGGLIAPESPEGLRAMVERALSRSKTTSSSASESREKKGKRKKKRTP